MIGCRQSCSVPQEEYGQKGCDLIISKRYLIWGVLVELRKKQLDVYFPSCDDNRKTLSVGHFGILPHKTTSCPI
jgi:hypothetical protein